jgi:hypothetical protein
MFDWFGRKSDYTNVVKFPEQIKIPEPYIEPTKKEQEYYSIGVTSENRITFKTGISTLTMSRKGIQDLIQQLQVFRDQLPEENNDT